MAQKPGVGATLYLVMGWAAALSMPSLAEHLGPLYLGLIVAGGIAYTVGAIGFATNWPNPRPASFGYHEVWHTFTLVAGSLLRRGGLGPRPPGGLTPDPFDAPGVSGDHEA